MKILLIEDDAAAAGLFRSLILDDITPDVVTVDSVSAADGVDADVALLDLRIRPDFRSETTLEKMSTLGAPVIVLTNDPRAELEGQSIAAGARYFFRKIDVIQNPSLLRDAIRAITQA